MTFWNMWRFQDLLCLQENDINVLGEMPLFPISLFDSIKYMVLPLHYKTTNLNACIPASLSCFIPSPTRSCSAKTSPISKNESSGQIALDCWYSLICISLLFCGTEYSDSEHFPNSSERSSYFMLTSVAFPFPLKAIPQDPVAKSIHFALHQF